MSKKKISVIGCGKMGAVILQSAMNNLDQYEFFGIEKNTDRIEQLGLPVIYKSVAEADISDVYILAVKPQNMSETLHELGSILKGKQDKFLVISIAAGIEIEYIESLLAEYNTGISVVRVMPNTPALVQEALSAISYKADMTDDEVAVVREVFSTMGRIIEISEKHMGAITALSGSGPAYFFYMAEVMQKFALNEGLEEEVAKELISQTIKGSGKYMNCSKKPYDELRREVTSPGGTTEAAVSYMEEQKTADIFYNALERALKRSKELSESGITKKS